MPKIAFFSQWSAFWVSVGNLKWAQTRNRRSFIGLAMLPLVTLLTFGSAARAADLKPETLEAWQNYLQIVDAQMQDRLHPGNSFIWIDESPERGPLLRGGEILASPAGARSPKRVPFGLIHHWIGAAFVPDKTLEDVFGVLRDYGRYQEYFHPVVIASKPLSEDRFSIILMNRSVLQHNALDSDYQSKYVQVDAHRWYSISHTTRMQEIQDYGQPGERELPAGSGSGYIWRLYSVSRFVERDGGVYVEVEAMALSRDIPASLRWLADPIVRRVSRSSLLTSLRQTQEAAAGVATARATPVRRAFPASFRQH